MIPGFEKIVEERIKKAHEEGAFDNLDGRHKPFVLETHHPGIDEECRLAYKILKNAGFLPPEIDLKKRISETELLLEATEAHDPVHRQIQKKLTYLLTKLDTLRGGVSPMLTDKYRANVVKKIS